MSESFKKFLLTNSDNYDNDILLGKVKISPPPEDFINVENFTFYEELFYRKKHKITTQSLVLINCPNQPGVMKAIEIIDFFVEKNNPDNENYVNNDGSVFLASKNIQAR